jgi:enoyl-CoA hydratase
MKMTYETILYSVSERVATITLNRPEKFNNIRPPMPIEVVDALKEANRDKNVRVIVFEGAGDSFCAGFDFSDGLDHFEDWNLQESAGAWDPGLDTMAVLNPFQGPIPNFMGIWRSPKPVITKIHGWCVGGGSEIGLLGDIVIASDDAQIGTPYSRVWGCHLTGMWIYRLGLTRAKHYALTGEPVSGKEAAEIGLINESCPLDELDERVDHWAKKLSQIPVTQLAAMKLVVNQAYDNMGLQTTQNMGCMLDGMMRNTPEAHAFVETANTQGVSAAVAERDGPFNDYSQASPDRKPGRRSRA